MEKKLRYIRALVIVIAIITCLSIYLLSARILFPKKYAYGCGMIDPGGIKPVFYPYLPDSILKTVREGEMLFEANCASCHSIHSVVVGPALKDIEKRRSRKWIRRFIKSPKEVIESGDRYAIKLAEDYKGAGVMSSFSSLTNKQINEIIEYCKVAGHPIP